MQTLIARLFWAGIMAVLFAALWDCFRHPEAAARAWKRFRPVVSIVLAVAVGFFAVNLLRGGFDHLNLLVSQTLRIASVAVGAGVFFCGGRRWVMKLGDDARSPGDKANPADKPKPPVGRAVAETAVLSLVAVGLSVAFLYFLEPKPSGEFKEWLNDVDDWNLRSGFFILMVLLAPIWEETAFRWYLLNRLGAAVLNYPGGAVAAVMVTSGFWACGHAAFSDPMWGKLGQIFVIGCLLGWRFRKIGLAGCVIVHLAVNMTALALSAISP